VPLTSAPKTESSRSMNPTPLPLTFLTSIFMATFSLQFPIAGSIERLIRS
jgi:hypothetical protein